MSEANGEDVVLDDWAKSKTKAILESMIIKGEIPDDDWPPARVYELKDEFKNTHYKRQFVSGLRRLRNEIKVRKVRVNFDRQAIDHDRRLYPAATITQQGFLRWPGSEAQRLMKQDVDNEVNWNMTPKQLYDSRPEFGNHRKRGITTHVRAATRYEGHCACSAAILQRKPRLLSNCPTISITTSKSYLN
jgi:hypothetical protein